MVVVSAGRGTVTPQILRTVSRCTLVWLVATEHVYNITNLGLNIHSDMLCDANHKKDYGSSPCHAREHNETH